jgi:hypothetical protein
MELAALAAFPSREEGELDALRACARHLQEAYGARVLLLEKPPLVMNSTVCGRPCACAAAGNC